MAGLSGVPIIILKEGSKRETGKEAQRKNIVAAKAIAEAVRTTLGPKGWTKCSSPAAEMLQSPTTAPLY